MDEDTRKALKSSANVSRGLAILYGLLTGNFPAMMMQLNMVAGSQYVLKKILGP